MSAIVKTDIEINKIIKHINEFGKVSGSTLNEEKTEILKIGKPKITSTIIKKEWVKNTVKILGSYLGENAEKKNLDKVLNSFKNKRGNVE